MGITNRQRQLAAMSPYERVMEKCARVGACLVWRGPLTEDGYGRVGFNGRKLSVHRVVYEYHHGKVPEGLQLDHVRAKGCRSRACCEIEHLEAVTSRENTMRGDSIYAKNAAKTHCVRGHELSETNLVPYALARGQRRCRICARAAARALYRARRASNIPFTPDWQEVSEP